MSRYETLLDVWLLTLALLTVLFFVMALVVVGLWVVREVVT